jgi:hypothetical protein
LTRFFLRSLRPGLKGKEKKKRRKEIPGAIGIYTHMSTRQYRSLYALLCYRREWLINSDLIAEKQKDKNIFFLFKRRKRKMARRLRQHTTGSANRNGQCL